MIWMTPSSMWIDDASFYEAEQEMPDKSEEIDEHIEWMTPMIQSLNSDEVIYLVSQIFTVYNSKI